MKLDDGRFLTVRRCAVAILMVTNFGIFAHPHPGGGSYGGNGNGGVVVTTQNPAGADDCFQQYRDTMFICALPFERRTPISEQDCKALCVSFGANCRGANYYTSNQRCDLYLPQMPPPFIPAGGNYQGTGNAWTGGTGGSGGYRRRLLRRRIFKRNWPGKNQGQQGYGGQGGGTQGGGHSGVIGTGSQFVGNFQMLTAAVSRVQGAGGRYTGNDGKVSQYPNSLYQSGNSGQGCGGSGGTSAAQGYGSGGTTGGQGCGTNTGGTGTSGQRYGPNTGSTGTSGQRYGPNTGSTGTSGQGYGGNSGVISRSGGYGTGNRGSGFVTSRPTQVQIRADRCTAGARLLSPCPGVNFYRNTDKCTGIGTTGVTSVTSGTGPTDATVSPTASTGDVCPAGEQPRFMRISGVELVGNDETSFDAATEQACSDACLKQQTPDGTSVACRSAEYSLLDKKCRLTTEQLAPAGNGQLNENPNVNYRELICLPDDVAASCQGPFVRQPQRILVGFAETVVDSSSLGDCLQQCINSQSLFGFECNSGMIFYEEQQLNCVLNTETSGSQPDLFIEEDTDAVDYFEPSCAGAPRRRADSVPKVNVLPLTKGDWGPWTPCNPRTRQKWRFSSCKTSNPNKCMRQSKGCVSRVRLSSRRRFSRTRVAARHRDLPSVTQQRRTRTRTGGCNPRRNCCPLLRANGSLDCRRGFRLTSSMGRRPCVPENCNANTNTRRAVSLRQRRRQ